MRRRNLYQKISQRQDNTYRRTNRPEGTCWGLSRGRAWRLSTAHPGFYRTMHSHNTVRHLARAPHQGMPGYSSHRHGFGPYMEMYQYDWAELNWSSTFRIPMVYPTALAITVNAKMMEKHRMDGVLGLEPLTQCPWYSTPS
ncbi:hypothetical protein FKP32DRAFT_1587118 [Trametes sanguinea]|nr:hypothetical protein FKP32DRAFT_1587118 [Trametes sanguinea]